jgi:hypothetical protein
VKLKLVIWTLLLSTSASTARAAECDPIIQDANRVIQAKNLQIERLKLGLEQAQSDRALLSREVKEKDEEMSAFYRNPVVMLSLGLLSGIVAGVVISK